MAEMTFFPPMGSGLSLSAISWEQEPTCTSVSLAQAANSGRLVNFH